jgi:hypothetical protein
VLIATYALDAPGHPMSTVLEKGLLEAPQPRRRGGRATRVSTNP